MFETFHINKL